MIRIIISTLLSISSVFAVEISYNRDVRPILSDKCFSCHGFDEKHRKAEMRLDTPEGAYGRAESGSRIITPGNLKASEVWQRIISTDPDEVMPPPETHKTFTPAEKDVIQRWIEAGAKYEKHWAFVLPQRDSLALKNEENPIDHFVRKSLQEKGLQLSPEASREALLRRLSFDLTGLPPTPDEVKAFLSDQQAGAYERQVERLMKSPRYSEQMAVAWLDVARYGDTNGYLHDALRTPWPWRDWVIKAYEEDMPFDQFVVEQLAGDLLPNAKPEQILATSFNRHHLITTEGGSIAEEYLNEYSADRVQTFGTAFLGMTMNCCRCHDHKFDPLTQDDFYSLQAFFNSTSETHDMNHRAQAFAPLIEIASPLLPNGPKAKVMVMDEAKEARPTYILERGQYDSPDKNRQVTRHTPLALGAGLDGLPQNRLGLAQWLVSEKNPLLARVTVNRLWQQFFGIGLVKSSDDFGLQGEYPSHPELLDWLALEFQKGNGKIRPWSQSHIIKLIVTSATYRQSSQLRPEHKERDPENRLLARFPRQRMTAEQIRDQAVFLTGMMNEERGGPPVFPYQPPGLWEERANGSSNTGNYRRSKGTALYRRSLYSFWKRTSPPTLMGVFDAPDRTSCQVRRVSTNTPLQALAVMNDEQFLESAKWIAVRTMKEIPEPRMRIQAMFQRVLSREAKPEDVKLLEEGYQTFIARFQANPADATELLKQGATPFPNDMNANEAAALMMVASVMLNLDEAVVKQ